ncbi:hypothetical protein OIU79_005241 [Salix purpurea]|uniref:Uncharacterized protein n=1 Tax=Salix purpurea TaxID=77065 RepID=A0A9Q0UCA6_SALPP|nr:hypothetical protein OIU79_005241 [Salix purpurea]
MAGVLHSLPGSNFRNRMGHNFKVLTCKRRSRRAKLRKLHHEYQNVNPSIESGNTLDARRICMHTMEM